MVQKKTIVTKACDRCKTKKRRCDGEQPCVSCEALDIPCTYVIQQKKRGPVPQSERVNKPKHDTDDSPFPRQKKRDVKRYSRLMSDSDSASEDFDELDTIEEPCMSCEHVSRSVSVEETNKYFETIDIKRMIQNYTVTSSIAKIISNQQLLESVSEFFSSFNATLPIFENPAEIIQKVLTNTLPIALLSSIVSVGAASKNHISDLTSSILAQLAHSNLHEITTTSELIQTVLLLQYHELGMYEDNNAWIYNSIATNLINQNSLQLNSNTACRLRKSVVVSDFFHAFMTKKPFQVTSSPPTIEVEESLAAFFDEDFSDRCALDNIETLYQLVLVCKTIYQNQEAPNNHHDLIEWFDKHRTRLTPSLNALACGGKILLQETGDCTDANQDPANILCHLMFFRFLSGIHQTNLTLQPSARLFYPTSTLNLNSCLATSLDIIAACYRAQNILLRVLYTHQTEIHSAHVFALCYLPELLIPCAEPLMTLPQYSYGMLLGTRSDPMTLESSRRGVHDLTPLSALFVPALEDNAKIWPVVVKRVAIFKRRIEAAKVELVFGSAMSGAAMREGGSEQTIVNSMEGFMDDGKGASGIFSWSDENDGIGDGKLGDETNDFGFDFHLSEKVRVFCDSLLDFSG